MVHPPQLHCSDAIHPSEDRSIDLQVCFWKAKRPVRVPSHFLRSSAQKALTPFQDAWQSALEPSPPIPSTAQIPCSTGYESLASWSSSTGIQWDCSLANTTATDAL